MKWTVWSWFSTDRTWVEVMQGSRLLCEDSVRRRMASATRLGIGGMSFVAMPPGEKPTEAPKELTPE